MKPQKRIRPLMGAKEIFSMPTVLLIPAMLISCTLAPLILIEGSLPKSNVIGAAFAGLVFAGLTIFIIGIPAVYAIILAQSGMDGTATILEKEKRSGTLITPDYNTRTTSTYVIFEFTPQGSSTPLQLEADVTKIGSKLSEGKTVKIHYAKSNPRIVKFAGE